jgi:hypothetical protein
MTSNNPFELSHRGPSFPVNKTRFLVVKLSILLKAFDFSWQNKKARLGTSVPIQVRRTGFNKSMFGQNPCPGTLVFPTGVSILLLSEMTTSSASFVILEKDRALIERSSLVYELLLRLTINRVTERRGRTTQNHRKAKLLEKTDLAQLTHGPAKHYIDKVRREIRRHEYLYYVKDRPGRRAGKKVGSRQSCRS